MALPWPFTNFASKADVDQVLTAVQALATKSQVTTLTTLASSLAQKVTKMADDFEGLVDEIGDWGVSWRDRAIAAEAAADASDAALQAFVAEDTETDAAQLAAQRADLTAVAKAKRDELLALDAPPADPPVVEPPEVQPEP